jgi:hypothetical protein
MNAEALQQVRDALTACEEQVATLDQELLALAMAITKLPPTRAGEDQLQELDAESERKQLTLTMKKRAADRLREQIAAATRPAGGAAAVPIGGTTNATGRGPTPVVPNNLPEYQATTDVEVFLKIFERRLVAYELPLDAHWVRLLPTCLPPADATLLEETLEVGATWMEACEWLRKRFGRPGRQDELRAEFRAMQRNRGESGADFARRFRDKASAAGINDAEPEALSALTRNMPLHLRMYVNGLRESGVDAGKSIALLTFVLLNNDAAYHVDTSELRSSSTAPIQRPSPITSTRLYCDIHRHHGHSTSECSQLNKFQQMLKEQSARPSTSKAPTSGSGGGGTGGSRRGQPRCYERP